MRKRQKKYLISQQVLTRRARLRGITRSSVVVYTEMLFSCTLATQAHKDFQKLSAQANLTWEDSGIKWTINIKPFPSRQSLGKMLAQMKWI